MNLTEIKKLFDMEQYNLLIDSLNPFNSKEHKDYEILYYLKSKLVLNNFKMYDLNEIKMLFFYYFYLKTDIEFENFKFSFVKDKLNINLITYNDEINKYVCSIDDLSYFNLHWKKILNINNLKTNLSSIKNLAIKKFNNIEDIFFLLFSMYSQLYVLKWEQFPLFKWLIDRVNIDR